MKTITTSDLAARYAEGTDATRMLTNWQTYADDEYTFVALWRRLVAWQYSELVKQTGVRVEFVSGQPFSGGNSAQQMFDSIDAGYLPVSTDFNESELNGSEGNLLFRAAHDLSHHLCDLEHRDEGHRCNFKLNGETRAMARQARHLLDIANTEFCATQQEREFLVQVAFSEVVLQAAVFYETGDFADQKVVLVEVEYINAWLVQNGEPAL